MKTFKAPDGLTWGVQITSPGSSNAIVYFRHPGGVSSSLDRYNWYLSDGPEARSVTSRLDPAQVLDRLDDATLRKLFARSMPISRANSLNKAPEPIAG